jgi:hypothetical protein
LVVLQPEGKAPLVTVAPITHNPHRDPEAAVEIPPAVKRHLGLDDQPSWIVLDDFNVFTWPGFDLRPIPGEKDRYEYGFLPPSYSRASSPSSRSFSDRAKPRVLHGTSEAPPR